MGIVQSGPFTTDVESDYDLLLSVAAGDAEDRRRATTVFFNRYWDAVYSFCYRSYLHSLGGEDTVSDLTIATFQRAFDRASTYNGEGIISDEHGRARTTRWLLTIAKNIFRDWITSSNASTPIPLSIIGSGNGERASYVLIERLPDNAEDTFEDSDAQRAFDVDDIDMISQRSPAGECLHNALEQLPDREREIVLLSAMYSVDGKQLEIPDDVRDGICHRWGTTKENIRTIRKRATAAIKQFVSMNCPQWLRS